MALVACNGYALTNDQFEAVRAAAATTVAQKQKTCVEMSEDHKCLLPKLDLLGPKSVTVVQNDKWSDPGSKCVGVDGESLTDQVEVEGDVDMSVPGTYTQKYFCQEWRQGILTDGIAAERTIIVMAEEQLSEPPSALIKVPVITGRIEIVRSNAEKSLRTSAGVNAAPDAGSSTFRDDVLEAFNDALDLPPGYIKMKMAHQSKATGKLSAHFAFAIDCHDHDSVHTSVLHDLTADAVFRKAMSDHLQAHNIVARSVSVELESKLPSFGSP